MQIQAAAAHKHVHAAHHQAPPKGAPKAAEASAAAPAAVVQISSKAQEAYAAAHPKGGAEAQGDADHDGDKK
jgi:hypothetical protein